MNDEQKNRILGFILIFLLILSSFIIFKYSKALKNFNRNVSSSTGENKNNRDNPNGISIVKPLEVIQNTKKEEINKELKEEKKNNSLIDINTATQYELLNIPGIGPKTADSIIDYRNKNGKFKSLEDILNVTGIGKVKLDNMRPYLASLPFDNNKDTKNNAQISNNSEMKICTHCKMPLKPNNSRIKSYKPYCTNCLKYLNYSSTDK